MKYSIEITNNETGETRNVPPEITKGDWDESDLYMWTDGNYSCDCNRGMFFNNWEDGRFLCGVKKYTVVKAVLEDGTEILIDEVNQCSKP